MASKTSEDNKGIETAGRRSSRTQDLGEALFQEGLINAVQLEDARRIHRKTGDELDRVLVRLNHVTEEQIAEFYSRQSHMPYVRLMETEINPKAIEKVPARVVLHYNFMPVDFKDGVCTVAQARPLGLQELDHLRLVLGCQVKAVLATPTAISECIKKFYGVGADTIQQILTEAPLVVEEVDTRAEETIDANAQDATIVKFVNQLMVEALRSDATDVHIEPFEERLRVRYRVDGLLQEVPVPNELKRFQPAICSRVKVMAHMNIAEHRLPQDGRIKIRTAGEEFDLRVSVLPTRWGETVNMRILNRKNVFLDLEHLGLGPREHKLLNSLIELPHGIILISGPTGSGKTTTLYASLAKINRPDIKIITVEDPIEYQLEGISQIQIHPKIDLTFANILRSVLRHDPDVILVGEIRDSETAEIAIRSALTGHLVFSTVHTNDAPSSITRLLDMDIEPFLVSSSLEGVIAQRLVRRICMQCREPDKVDPVIVEEIEKTLKDRKKPLNLCRGRGCANCKYTGYRGRVAIFEMMLMSDEIRSMTVRHRPANEIRQRALEEGLVTLRMDGWAKAADGLTTVEEVVRTAPLHSKYQ
jgi:type II secretory ATPase GspE/PulE/Tfp pilus assembly ATPase PilB-like protein